MTTGSRKTRLELTWIGKENRPRLEPRILLEDSSKSYHAKVRRGKDDRFDNRLIFGDNLLALKALEAEFAGKIKCIYIDPPYNTGSAFTHYDDGIEHSLWLSLMRDRLEILRRLLADDGSIWVSLDDNEGHYCKVVMDEIFGRANFVTNMVWQKKYAPANDAIWFSDSHDHILVFAKNKEKWRPNRLERSEEANAPYKNPDDDPRGLWRPDNYTSSKTADERPNLYYAIKQPNTGKEIWPKRTRVWAYDADTHARHVRENLIWWGKSGTNDVPSYKRFLHDVNKGTVAQTVWTWREVGHNQDAKREQQALHPKDPFATPKPESLLGRIIEIGSNPGDWVLDSFAGSGTTGAVAHKMGRRWIMVELQDTCHTHIIPRLTKVIDGTDPGGVTEATGWKGGGGFRYSKLAPSLLKKDKFGQWVINPEYNAEMLAEALCKVEGFKYEPSTEVYWQHGYSTESDFIYVTTQTLTRDQLQKLSDEVGSGRSLLIMCRAFRAKIGKGEFPNLTVRKIPKAVLAKCEWDRDDYSLEIKALPKAPPEPDDEPTLNVQSSKASNIEPKSKAGSGAKGMRRKVAAALNGDSLFGNGGN
jgi:adenine-specific DNA-methyltransferase